MKPLYIARVERGIVRVDDILVWPVNDAQVYWRSQEPVDGFTMHHRRDLADIRPYERPLADEDPGLEDAELPGMWERADFMGGSPDTERRVEG